MADEGRPGDALAVSTAAERFSVQVGRPPDGLWRAPGRVNLIGEHTDYNCGLALPFAIDRATVVAAGRRSDRLVRVYSTTMDDQATANLDDLAQWGARGIFPAGHGTRWESFGPSRWGPEYSDRPQKGRVIEKGRGNQKAQMGQEAQIGAALADGPGLDLVISSDVPLRSGLSSSAALTVAVSVAVNDIYEMGLSVPEIARVAQWAEAGFAGMPCGLLDQLAALEGRPGAGVLIDFSTLATELVPLDAGPLAVVNTRVEHANASGAYADRRRACEMAAERLGVPSLSQATLAQVESELDGELRNAPGTWSRKTTECAKPLPGFVNRTQSVTCW